MFAPVPIMALALLFGAIQAVVFTTLAAIYIGDVLERAGERTVAAGQPHTQGGTQS
jgi:F-type H+-transporting ATPase subunit a